MFLVSQGVAIFLGGPLLHCTSRGTGSQTHWRKSSGEVEWKVTRSLHHACCCNSRLVASEVEMKIYGHYCLIVVSIYFKHGLTIAVQIIICLNSSKKEIAPWNAISLGPRDICAVFELLQVTHAQAYWESWDLQGWSSSGAAAGR